MKRAKREDKVNLRCLCAANTTWALNPGGSSLREIARPPSGISKRHLGHRGGKLERGGCEPESHSSHRPPTAPFSILILLLPKPSFNPHFRWIIKTSPVKTEYSVALVNTTPFFPIPSRSKISPLSNLIPLRVLNNTEY